MSLESFTNDRTHVVTKFSRLCPSVRGEVSINLTELEKEQTERETARSSTTFLVKKVDQKQKVV